MKYILAVLACLAVTFIVFYYLNRMAENELPRISMAHGVLIEEGKMVWPEVDYIINVQNRFISIYSDSLSREAKRKAEEIQSTIFSKVDDEVLANALYLDWFIHDLNKNGSSTLYKTNEALRQYYIHNIQTELVLNKPGESWSKGIGSKIKEELIATGLKIFDESVSAPRTYINNCISQGVPIPDQIFDNQWESLGILNDKILDEGTSFSDSDSELRMYLSNDPPGFCLSMTRHDTKEFGNHFDLICFGTESNNACFFESTREGINTEEDLHITELQAGENVFGETCINCHAGENPFIVHPGDPAFIAAAERKGDFFETPPNLNGTDMFTAINVPSWPKNPPPFDNLSLAGTDASQCTTCHNSLNAGRFPNLKEVPSSSELKDAYCNTILSVTLNGSASFDANMPFEDLDNKSDYQAQIDHLLFRCGDTYSGPDSLKIVINNSIGGIQ